MSTTNVLLAAAMYRGTVTQVTVQASVVPGIGIHVVGLPDELVAEMLLRVLTAIQQAGYHTPGKKVVIYVSELGRHAGFSTDIRQRIRRGQLEALDLAIALQLLIATGQIPDFAERRERIVTGSLAIDGTIHAPFTGLGSSSDAAAVLDEYLRLGFRDCIGWAENLYASDMNVWRGFATLSEVIEAIKNQTL